MRNPILIWKIINSLNIIPMIFFLFTIMHWPIFFKVTVPHILIFVVVIYGLKSWVEIKSDVSNPIKNNKWTKKMSFFSGVIIMVGFVFRTLHWPFSNSLLIIGFLGIILSNIMIFFIEDNEAEKESNPEILDDI